MNLCVANIEAVVGASQIMEDAALHCLVLDYKKLESDSSSGSHFSDSRCWGGGGWLQRPELNNICSSALEPNTRYPLRYKLISEPGHPSTAVARVLAHWYYWDIVRNIQLYWNIERRVTHAPTPVLRWQLDIGHGKPLVSCIELGIALEKFSDISVINLMNKRMEFIENYAYRRRHSLNIEC